MADRPVRIDGYFDPRAGTLIVGPGRVGIAPLGKRMAGRAQLPAAVTLTRTERWLTRLFPCTLLDGGGRCPYLRRWLLWSLGGPHGRRLYLHHFLGDDWSLDLHDHSSRFVSIGLRGSYDEYLPDRVRRWRAPWIRTFPAAHQHRLVLVKRPVWTLVYQAPTARVSQFWHQGEPITAGKYRNSPIADARKSC